MISTIFLSDINNAEFDGKKGRSGRKKGSGKSKSRNRTVNTSGGRVIDKPTNSTVTYKSELSPVQKLSAIAVAYRNIASPTANLLTAGAGVRRLMQNLEIANRKPTGWEKASRLYDGSINKIGNTSRSGGSVISSVQGWKNLTKKSKDK